MSCIEWAPISLEARIGYLCAATAVSENQIVFVGPLTSHGYDADETSTLACVFVTRKSDGSFNEEVVVTPFREMCVPTHCMTCTGGDLVLLVKPEGKPFFMDGFIAVLSLDSRRWEIIPVSEIPSLTSPLCIFALGQTLYIAGNTHSRDYASLVTYDTETKVWGQLESERVGGAISNCTVVGDTAYILAYQGEGDTEEVMWSYREGEGFSRHGLLPQMIGCLSMESFGRHTIMLASLEADELLHPVSYSTVSGESVVYDRVGDESSLMSWTPIGPDVMVVVDPDYQEAPYRTAMISLPGGDDYVSAGRWNVMDPDHN
ncbi:hypothetical protein KIPB_007293 [Kipferlia bialata]|uniref:Uncharacterized protein n=1 Tax=Kipferlia bialata TaxID=797122 RepID=A0A391P3Q8_9EUKA|nr:hypothetical protein KIPB_007293 [Kipferlia bialata]|eukprot:g7293.t1